MSRKAPDELNLRMSARVDDVRGMVVQFLDRAYRAGHFRVFIIHGKGQAATERGLSAAKRSAFCGTTRTFGSASTTYTSPPPDRGGEGAAQVNLRR